VQTFVNKRLRQILGIFWSNVITNEDLWVRTGQENVAIVIKRRKWKWIGHTLRKEKENTTRIAMKGNPQGKRKTIVVLAANSNQRAAEHLEDMG